MKSEDMEVWHETQRYGMAQRMLGQKGLPKKPSGGLPQGLDDQRIQHEADRIASAFQNLTGRWENALCTRTQGFNQGKDQGCL